MTVVHRLNAQRGGARPYDRVRRTQGAGNSPASPMRRGRRSWSAGRSCSGSSAPTGDDEHHQEEQHRRRQQQDRREGAIFAECKQGGAAKPPRDDSAGDGISERPCRAFEDANGDTRETSRSPGGQSSQARVGSMKPSRSSGSGLGYANRQGFAGGILISDQSKRHAICPVFGSSSHPRRSRAAMYQRGRMRLRLSLEPALSRSASFSPTGRPMLFQQVGKTPRRRVPEKLFMLSRE